MKLDFNETTILIQSIDDLEARKRKVTKETLVNLFYELAQNTNKKYNFIRQSIKSLAVKIELLSEKDIERIYVDAKNKNIVATAGYNLPSS